MEYEDSQQAADDLLAAEQDARAAEEEAFDRRSDVVQALWQFLRHQQTRTHDCHVRTPGSEASANLAAIGEGADAIMEIFGYDPAAIPPEGDGCDED